MLQSSPDPEYFKGPYAPDWKRHAKNVKALHAELVKQFPVLKDSIEVGLGAESGELIKIPPHEKNGADLTLYFNYDLLCHIEVSGSGSPNVKIPPAPIFIRPGKLDLAKSKEEAGEPYFFWMVYNNVTWLVPSVDAQPYRKPEVPKNFRGVAETYCEVPAVVAKPKEELFHWLGKELRIRGAPPS